jgi:hypothetical protein
MAFCSERRLQWAFGLLLQARLLYPFFDSPLDHLFSDPQRHWDNGGRFLNPGIMGSTDPFLYQLWMFALRQLARGSAPTILLGCGLLCAAMPYGWYRALRELQPRRRALFGAIVIALVPESFGLYAYFMNETLLLTLLGYCFWLTLRARRKGTVSAFGLAAALWLCAAFTRTVAVPMAAACLAWIWAAHARRLPKAAVGLALALLFAIPAGLHARSNLAFFAPFGNLYFNEIYSTGGTREIAVDYGPQGNYHFGCPSFYNPTFYPFSDWTTDRVGVTSIRIDLPRGRAAWRAEKARVRSLRTFPAWRQRGEDALYLFFGQNWPNSDRSSVLGWLTLWTRWAWAPLIGWVAWALWRGRYRGPAAVLPLCALGTLGLLLLQGEGVMEARFREPLDAIFVAAAWVAAVRRPTAAHAVQVDPGAA